MHKMNTLCPACGKSNRLWIDKVSPGDLLEEVNCSACAQPLGVLRNLLTSAGFSAPPGPGEAEGNPQP